MASVSRTCHVDRRRTAPVAPLGHGQQRERREDRRRSEDGADGEADGGVGHAVGLESLDLDAVVVEDGAAAHVGVALLDRRVDVRAAAQVLEPVALGRGDHAGAHAVA